MKKMKRKGNRTLNLWQDLDFDKMSINTREQMEKLSKTEKDIWVGVILLVMVTLLLNILL